MRARQLVQRVLQRQAEVLLVERLLELRADRLRQLVGDHLSAGLRTRGRRGARATAGRAPRGTAPRTRFSRAARACSSGTTNGSAKPTSRRQRAAPTAARRTCSATSAERRREHSADQRRRALGVVCTPDCSIQRASAEPPRRCRRRSRSSAGSGPSIAVLDDGRRRRLVGSASTALDTSRSRRSSRRCGEHARQPASSPK